MNNVTHEDLVDMLFREIQSANNLIGILECTGFMSMERWNFMLEYISELSEIQNEVLEDFERYKHTIQK